MVGKAVVKIYVLRDKFYKEMLNFIRYLIVEIDFYQTKICDLFDRYINENKLEFGMQLCELKEMLLGGKSANDLLSMKNFYFLKREEQNTLKTYFLQMGIKGVEIEINNLKKIEDWVRKKSEESSVSRKNNEGLIYKVSLALGAVFCILSVPRRKR